MTKSNIALFSSPLFVTEAALPGSPVVTVPTCSVAAVPVVPASPLGPVGPVGPLGPVGPVEAFFYAQLLQVRINKGIAQNLNIIKHIYNQT